MGRDEQNGELHHPEDQVADHLLRSNADAIGDVVRDVEVRWPDGPDDLSHSCGASVCLDGVPEESRDGSRDNCEAGEVPATGSPHCNRERDVESGTDDAVEDEWHGAHKTTEDDTDNSFAPRGTLAGGHFRAGTAGQREGVSYQVKPRAIIDAGAIQLCAFKASENQYPNMVQEDQVRRSRGVTSQSMLVLRPDIRTPHLEGEGAVREGRAAYQAPSSAKDEA